MATLNSQGGQISMFKFLGRVLDETSQLIGDITGLNKMAERQKAKQAEEQAAHRELNIALRSVLEESVSQCTNVRKLEDLNKL